MDKRAEDLEYIKLLEGSLIEVDYRITIDRIYEGMLDVRKGKYWLYIFLSLYIGFLVYYLSSNMLMGVFSGIIFYLFKSLVYRKIYYKIRAKSIYKSINSKYLFGRIFFFIDYFLIINRDRIIIDKMNYEDFYKIKKTKKAYIFFLQKYAYYYLKFSELSDDDLINLDKVLEKYIK